MTPTQWVIVSIITVTLLIDAYLALTGGKEKTISVVLTKWSKQYPIIPFAFGLLMGHLFAQNT